MSKRLFTLIQALLVFGAAGQVYAKNTTYEVYEHGRYVGTTSMPADRYSGMAGRLNATGLTLRPKVDPAAVAARREAAERQQEQWKRENEQRRIAAQQKQEQWKRDAEQRRRAAQLQHQQFKDNFARRHAAAQQGFRAWQMAR
ncbi:MAG: hypothetical protein IT572_03815 [Deltaproteobacteria bacterium]|nr:hypothetical protein [Deltaproteobacteria bacterium]